MFSTALKLIQSSSAFISRKGGRRRSRPRSWTVEPLEKRELLASTGSEYVLSGFTWNDPSHITYSFAPDGVYWDHGVNNLNAVMDAKFGAGIWEKQIARALATWESVTNVNFALVGDSAYDQNALGRPQGDSRFGDIRFGGYGFANDTTTLAQTFFPPPNGSTAAGDVEINTNMDFGIGGSYDLYSVMLHELGHTLGLDHVSDSTEAMYPKYQGLRQGLSAGDIAGVQAMYGARTPDSYQAQGQGLGFGTAIDLSGRLGGTGIATLAGISLFSVGDTEYFTAVAPQAASGTLQVAAAGWGISMISPKVSLFDANGTLIDTAANPAAFGTNAVAHAWGVLPGQRFYMAVTGATGDAFSVGSYAIQAAFSTKASSDPLPGPTALSPNDSISTATPLGTVSQANLAGLSLSNGNDSDYYVFQNGRAGVSVVSVVSASGTIVRVVDARGNIVASGLNQVVFRIARPRSMLFVEVSSSDGNPVSDYGLAIAVIPSQPVVRRRIRKEHATAVDVTPSPMPHHTTPSWARAWSARRNHH